MLLRFARCSGWYAPVVAILMISTGCVTTPDLPAPEDMNCSEAGDALIEGDTLSVNFEGPSAPASIEQKIRSNGIVVLPPPMSDVRVVAAGKTVTELENEIQSIAEKMFRRITVFVTEQRFYSVSGEVRAPSQYIHRGRSTVLQAIASAGGESSFGDMRRIQVTRANGRKFVVDCVKAQRDAAYDPAVCPGDIVHVPHRRY